MAKKHSYITEIIIGIAIIIFINVMWFPQDLGFANVSPNPYWIIVLMIAARYGSLPGIIGAFLCSLALLASVSFDMAWQRFEVLEIPYKQVQLSGLFILFGFLIGEERRRVNRIIEKQKEDLDRFRDKYENLAMDRLAAKDVIVELEGRILGQTDTVSTLYEVASHLATTNASELYPSIANLVKRIVAPDKCSLYILEGHKYTLKGHAGWGPEIEKRKTLGSDSPVINLALKEKRLVTVKDAFKANLQWEEETDPAIVSPIFFGEDREKAKGLILIDKISFLKLNPDSIRLLTIMSDWISKSLNIANVKGCLL